MELGQRLCIPDAIAEQAFESFCKEGAKDERVGKVRKFSLYSWAGLFLYKVGRGEGCPLTMKAVAGVCGISEKELWRLMKDRREFSLMRSYTPAHELFPKFAAVFRLSIEERRKVLPLIHQIQQKFPSCSPDSILSYAFYSVIGPSRAFPRGFDKRAIKGQKGKKRKECMAGPISARLLTKYLGTSTTVLFRIKKLYEKSISEGEKEGEEKCIAP